jgi:hypothetical protein
MTLMVSKGRGDGGGGGGRENNNNSNNNNNNTYVSSQLVQHLLHGLQALVKSYVNACEPHTK